MARNINAQQNQLTQSQQNEDEAAVGQQNNKYYIYEKFQAEENTQNSASVSGNKSSNLPGWSLNPKVSGNNTQKQTQSVNYTGNNYVHQTSRSFGLNSSRTNASPLTNQFTAGSYQNSRNENNPLPASKLGQMNNLQGNNSYKPENSLSNSMVPLTYTTTNTTNINTTTMTTNTPNVNSATASSVNSLSISNAATLKSMRPEYLRPDEKEKRRLTYQAPINSGISYKVAAASQSIIIYIQSISIL